jgi:pyruvate formate lyase activating enzyme
VSETASWFESQASFVHCLLCPKSCRIETGVFGACRVRQARDGRLELPFFGRLSSLAIDPVEKKPLYHFYPGKKILSLGFFGCNLHCPFCQNHAISQRISDSPVQTLPAQLIETACRADSFGLAYTYSEPLVHFEYVLETSHLARKQGLKNVLVTNGYLNSEPALEILALTDAANIDLKSFSDAFYRDELGGSLAPVLDFIAAAVRICHVEVTTLVIPGKNDSLEQIRSIADFLSSLDPDIPLHLSCYQPRYQYTIRPTKPDDLTPLLAEARRRLRFVYAGNTAGNTDTVCPSCHRLLVERRQHSVRIIGFSAGYCTACGARVPIIQ